MKKTLPKSKVAAKLLISNRTLEYWCSNGTFPKPFYLGRRAFWLAETVEQWIMTQAQQQGGNHE
jgi:predicted DNA-binding transcriptional regulator AlpA